MREIKFRAWDTIGEQWIHITGFETAETQQSEGYTIFGVGAGIFHDGDYIGSENIVIMQFTGLKDKNGKEIYEGDIFPPAERTRGEVTIVCYDSKQGKYKSVPVSLFKANAGNGGWTGYDLNQYSEVIGNIHDNPEILHQK